MVHFFRNKAVALPFIKQGSRITDLNYKELNTGNKPGDTKAAEAATESRQNKTGLNEPTKRTDPQPSGQGHDHPKRVRTPQNRQQRF
jgi:hypothetical protein